jgi:hypothetical protein
MNLGRILKKALQSNDLPTEFAKWREIVADQNQWRAICGSKMKSAKKRDTNHLTTKKFGLSFDTTMYLHECKNFHGNSR